VTNTLGGPGYSLQEFDELPGLHLYTLHDAMVYLGCNVQIEGHQPPIRPPSAKVSIASAPTSGRQWRRCTCILFLLDENVAYELAPSMRSNPSALK